MGTFGTGCASPRRSKTSALVWRSPRMGGCWSAAPTAPSVPSSRFYGSGRWRERTCCTTCPAMPIRSPAWSSLPRGSGYSRPRTTARCGVGIWLPGKRSGAAKSVSCSRRWLLRRRDGGWRGGRPDSWAGVCVADRWSKPGGAGGASGAGLFGGRRTGRTRLLVGGV